jgi:type VI secretion system protein
MTVTFDEQGGSIGRKDDNDWVLPDPERFISGRHAQIDFSDGSFYIIDLSSNGLFINRSTQPLGKNNRVTLHDGDSITIGDYEIGVVIEKPMNQPLERSGFEGLEDPFARMVDAQAGQDLEGAFSTPFDELPEEKPVIENGYSLNEQETPSLGLDESPLEGGASNHPSQSDHTPDLNAYFNQPTPIPEDWDQEDDASKLKKTPFDQKPIPASTSKPSLIPDIEPMAENELPPTPMVSKEAIPRPGQQAAAAAPPPVQGVTPAVTPSSDEVGLRRILAESIGIPEEQIADLPMVALIQNLGQILRVSVSGIMSMLRARAQMKGEFRMSQTMIQPVENNPLKFSINIEEALLHIINPKPSSGYLPPLSAFEEAHEDIEAHMLAVMVGMQAALHTVLQRFKPEILEQRLGQQALLEKLPLYKQAKTWELFTELYTKIANEAEDDFHQLFGRAFAHAYEEQIRRLESLKRSEPGSSN